MARIRRDRTQPPLEDVFTAIQAGLLDSDLAPSTVSKYGASLRRFHHFLDRGVQLSTLADVEPDHVERFVRAPSGPGGQVTVSTMHSRRAAVRATFKAARELGLVMHDPTRELELPHRSAKAARALTASEVGRCRTTSLHTLHETRLPTAWALAEATATAAEIASMTAADADLERGLVRISGSPRYAPRWGELTSWGAEHLRRRVERLPSPLEPLVYRAAGSSNSAQASSAAAIRWTLVRAGLGADPRVKPSSVRAWRARGWLDEGVPIQEIASRLGMSSLDRVAAVLDDSRPQ